MKKLSFVLFMMIFSLVFSQLSEINKIDKEVQKRNSKIYRKYKKEFPEKRKLEETEVENFRREGYSKAIANIQKVEVKIDLNSIQIIPTKNAEYETGINGFRDLFAKNFDTSIFDSKSGTIKSVIRFLIDENGKISNVEAKRDSQLFNQVLIITLYRIIDKGKWKPAVKDGVAIKDVFRLPMAMQFD